MLSKSPLSENFLSVLSLSDKKIITAVGGGGKTSLLTALGKACAENGERILITTTTHMLRPSFLPKAACVEEESLPALEKAFLENSLVALGLPDRVVGKEMKWKAPCAAFLKGLARRAKKDGTGSGTFPSRILCEGDGAKCLPVKLPKAHEPVFFPETDAVIGVVGLSCLGKPPEKALFRRKLLPEVAPTFSGDRITTELLFEIILSEKGLMKHCERTKMHVLLNQADVLNASQLPSVMALTQKIRDNGVRCDVVSLKNRYVLSENG